MAEATATFGVGAIGAYIGAYIVSAATEAGKRPWAAADEQLRADLASAQEAKAKLEGENAILVAQIASMQRTQERLLSSVLDSANKSD